MNWKKCELLTADLDLILVLPFACYSDILNVLKLIIMMATSSSITPTPSTSREGERGCGEEFPPDEPYVKRNLYSLEVLGMWNLSKIVRELSTREQCVTFAEEHGLGSSVECIGYL